MSAWGIEHGPISKGVPKGMKRLRLTTHELPGITSVRAHKRKKLLGEMQVVNEPGAPDHGTIWGMEVGEKHRRKGLATAMYQHAQRKGLNPQHSILRTEAGDKWAQAVGGHRPPIYHYGD